MRAGFSEATAKSGSLAEMCRDAAIMARRDQRLAELQKASGVTVEDQLIGLQALAQDSETPAKDRVAARKAILAWYAQGKGQHKPEPTKASAPAKSVDDWADEFAIEVLGVSLNEETA